MRPATGTRLLSLLLLLGLMSAVGASCGPEPDPDPTVGVPQRTARWTGWLPGELGTPVAATVVGTVVVVFGDRDGVAVFDRGTGGLRWQYRAAERDTLRKVRVTGTAVVFLLDRLVQVRDLATGALRRELTDVRVAAVSWTTLYVARWCSGGGCPLVALDIGTGRELWRYDAPVSDLAAEFGESIGAAPATPAWWRPPRAAEPAVLLLRVTDTPADELVALDAASGQPESVTPFPAPGAAGTATGPGSPQTYLQWVHNGQCQVSVTAYSLRDGTTAWSAAFGAWELVAQEPRCGLWTPVPVAGGLLVATANGRPRVVDVDSGLVRWTGEPTARQVAAGDGVVVVRRDNGLGSLTAFDAATGERRWGASLPEDASGTGRRLSHATAGGGHLAYRTEYVQGAIAEDLLWLRNLTSGQVTWVAREAGTPIGLGPDWLVTTGGAVTTTPPPASVPPPGPNGPPVPSDTPPPAPTPIHLYQP